MKEQLELKIGDVVCLRAGGQPMTVENVLADGLIACVWFDNEDHLQHDTYWPHSLKLC